MVAEKAKQAFRLLSEGGEIKTDQFTFVFDDDFNLCTVAGDKLYKVNFGSLTVSEFVGWANTLTDEWLTIATANAALNGILQDKARERPAATVSSEQADAK